MSAGGRMAPAWFLLAQTKVRRITPARVRRHRPTAPDTASSREGGGVATGVHTPEAIAVADTRLQCVHFGGHGNLLCRIGSLAWGLTRAVCALRSLKLHGRCILNALHEVDSNHADGAERSAITGLRCPFCSRGGKRRAIYVLYRLNPTSFALVGRLCSVDIRFKSGF